MNVNFNCTQYMDYVIERVAISSGLLLTPYDVIKIMPDDENLVKSYNISKYGALRVRAENIENTVLDLRVKIGNLPDNRPFEICIFDTIKEIMTYDPDGITNLIQIISKEGINDFNKVTIPMLLEESKAKPETLIRYLKALDEYIDRSIIAPPRVNDWDGVLSLSDLFENENLPSNPEQYLDQRFIDYLVKNDQDLKNIHWRNFERLISAFFSRLGYVVVLGPGYSDGGVDIRIWKEDGKEGPPLMLIQCKRYKDLVSIETIKAIYFDMKSENAQYGLIATTGDIPKGGKKICECRDYNLKAADYQKVSRWLKTMWRYSWNNRIKKAVKGERLV